MTNLQFDSIKSNDSTDNTLEISSYGYKAKAANGRLIEVDTLGKGAIQKLPHDKIDEIIIGNGIRSIQYHSVSNSKVKTITLSESVEYLNPMAFAECNELTTINLPNQSPLYSNWNKREFISRFAFDNPNVTINITENGKINEQIRCNGEFVYSVSNGEVALLSCPYSTGELRLPEEIDGCPVTRIESYFLEHNEDVEKVIIPSTVTEIGHGAFFYCKSLNTVGVEGIAEGECIIPESVKNIGYRSFAGCNFDSCVISSSVNVDESAFDHCEYLTTVTITNPDVKFGEEAFEGCENLTSIRLPKSWESKGKEALEAIELDPSNPNLKITYGDQSQAQSEKVNLNNTFPIRRTIQNSEIDMK